MRKLHNEALHYLYSLPNVVRMKSRRIRWAVPVACMERTAHSILLGKPEGKRPLGRPKCGWEYNIKMDL
jgi:hypothetical protein